MFQESETELPIVLSFAAWTGDIKEVRRIVQDPRITSIINIPNDRGMLLFLFPNSFEFIFIGQSPLYSASRAGHANVVLELLNVEGIDINVQATGHGSTPLHGMYRIDSDTRLTSTAASHAEHVEVLALLLVRGANEKVQNVNSLTMRQEAKGSSIDVIRDWDTQVHPRATQPRDHVNLVLYLSSLRAQTSLLIGLREPEG